jgi:hypothetical protein
MRNKTCLWLTKAFAVCAISFLGQSARAQYTGEFIICTDGSSADACRKSALPPDDDGTITWFRDFGSNLCAGVGIVPQETDCNFFGDSYRGFGCTAFQDRFGARVPAGEDLALACGDVSPLDDGQYSLGTTDNTCFTDDNLCLNFILTR